MRLLSLPTQSLSNYCTLEAPSRHWGGYVIFKEFSINAQHNRFISLIPELGSVTLFGISAQYYSAWVSSHHRIIANVTS